MFTGKLQRKILVMVVSLIFLIMTLMLGLFIYTDHSRTFESARKTSLQNAKLISFMDSVHESLLLPNGTAELKPIIDYYQYQTDASFIVVKDREGKILMHPSPERIGKVDSFKDEFTAIVFGGYSSEISSETIDVSIIGIAPIYNENQIIGTVKVGYFIMDLNDAVFKRAKNLFLFSILILIAGILSSVWLAKSIRKDTLGLEPEQIASLYSVRNAILSSISEGIIAIDASGNITLMNSAAKKILDLPSSYISKPIQSVIPSFMSTEQEMDPKVNSTFELNLKGKILIMNTMPLRDGIHQTGAVITFKDRTEMTKIVNRLFEVSKYSENLRAQTHEFTNKLYVISGHLQLGNYAEVIEMIQEEIEVSEYTNRLVFEHIKDPNVQAILLGKMGKASEMKISFSIDENSSLEKLPPFIRTGELTVIIGNLIDNAFDAVSTLNKGEVRFFALDIGDDIIIEITDNGPGIQSDSLFEVFNQGFTTKKQTNHGFGLANVHKIVQSLDGDVEVTSDASGTTFSVYIPKNGRQKGSQK